ncbi:MAG: hypothetical protein IH596_09815 [Bacteroidales bacterium]|nr:hypothetical protein [Bacteroidales bacterium]
MKPLPLSRSTSVFSDIRQYFLNKPLCDTLIRFSSDEVKEAYCNSIMQRIGIDVHQFKLMNIHRVGIEVPSSYLFYELMKWNGDSICWPNHMAKVNLQEGKIDNIVITLLGRFYKLFVMKSIRIHQIPALNDTDNARYFLYQCSGGYPIGIFSLYVRTSIPERGEEEMSQLFFLTSFNFYGKQFWSRIKPLRAAWEFVHNRVTANVACRFKQLVEWKFENLKHPDIADQSE